MWRYLLVDCLKRVTPLISVIKGTSRHSRRLFGNGRGFEWVWHLTIVGTGGEWRVRHDGKAENVYQKKESAFEAAVAAASLALRQGHEVEISAPGSTRERGTENSQINRRNRDQVSYPGLPAPVAVSHDYFGALSVALGAKRCGDRRCRVGAAPVVTPGAEFTLLSMS
jgi:hypothetical protein